MLGIWEAIRARFHWLGNSLGLISTIVVGGFVAYQYFDSKWKSRIERSLNYAVMAQEPEKVKARNATDLWPPTKTSKSGEVDVDLIAKSISIIGNPDFIEQHIPETNILDDPEASKKFSGILADRAATKLADALFDVATESRAGAVEDDGEWSGQLKALNDDKCKDTIKSYVEKLFDKEQEENKNYKDWRDKIVDASGFATKMGTVVEIDEEKYWFEGSVKYQYTWPIILKRFFQIDHKGNALEQGSEHCRTLIDRFEKEVANTSPGILDQLHELKNFYAALSICTTSGLCDSRVACEIFHADIYRFQEEWRSYFELWSASENGETGYVKLPGFSIHCQSNYYFVGRQVRELTWYEETFYYFQNFWNIW